MKVLHIITALSNGGAEGVLERLINADQRNTHEVISLMDRGLYGERLAVAGIPVHALEMPRRRVTLASMTKLYHLVRAIRPDVVQTWLYHSDLIGGVIARMAGAKCIVWGIRNSVLEPGKVSRSTRVVARLNASASHWIPTRIICCSQEAARVHAGLGYEGSKITVVPNGYDLTKLKPDNGARLRVRNEFGVPPAEMVLGMVARWDPMKDHQNLIAALGFLQQRDLTNWRVWLVGPDMTAENAELSWLLQHHEVSGRVQLLGPRNDIPSVCNALDLHILSSVSEGFPNVLAEAMACGTPCVSTDVGDAALIIGDTGWLVPPRDSVKLSGAIEHAMYAMANREHWATRQHAARDRIASMFDLETMIDAYNDLWSKSVLSN